MTFIRKPFWLNLPVALYGALCPLSLAFAQDGVAVPGVSTSAAFQMILGLILVMAIFFFGAFFINRLNGKSFGRPGPLKIMGGVTVGVKERILLVEIGDTWLVVGIVPGQIRTLHTLPKGEAPDLSGEQKPFVFWLSRLTDAHHEKP